MACCPFHHDRHPSMKVDDRYYCFACHENGDVIDFVGRLFNLAPYDAAVKIANDFGFPAMTLTIPELAKELHICEKTARQLVREPDFPSFNIGKRILVNREALQRWINIHSAQPLTDGSKSAA